jgi:biopolymer transport protein ExbD
MTDENVPESGIADGSQPFEGWPADVEDGAPTPRKRRKKRRGEVPAQALSINSLMDIVTILLVYLIKSYATSPIDVQDPSIQLPTSTSGETVEEAAVVMVTGPLKAALDQAGNRTFEGNIPNLVVDQRPLFPLEPKQSASAPGGQTWRVPAAQKTPQEESSFVITTLKAELEKARKTQEVAAEITDREFTGKVVILADKQTPYRVLMDILVTCGQAGFGEFKFAIVKDEG